MLICPLEIVFICCPPWTDYLQYRNYAYERLDGSVRGEERYLAVKNFSEKMDAFVFLLSTRAGGVGLNLTASDTVIFMDSDFNPQARVQFVPARGSKSLADAGILLTPGWASSQADLQAAARVHRIGQTKPVTIVRLLCRDTVEDVIMQRAACKLQLAEVYACAIHSTGCARATHPAALVAQFELSWDQAVMAGTNVPDADGPADRKSDPYVDEVVSALKVHSV